MSKQLFLVVAAAALAQLSAATLGLSAQEPPQIQQPYEPADVSEKDLRAFAKCYVEFHKIRTEYEPAFQGAHSPQEKKQGRAGRGGKVRQRCREARPDAAKVCPNL
jgi:hypothetical protein